MQTLLRLAATAAVLILTSSVASAHDTWLLPERFTAMAGADLGLDLTSGMEFPAPDHAIKPERVAAAGWRLAGKSDSKLRPTPADKSLRFTARPAAAGVATAWVSLKPRSIELTEKQVGEYLDEIEASEEIRKAWAGAGKDRRWREVYTKHAKTFVRVGQPRDDRSWSEPVGAALEIVPEKDPTALRVGDKLTLRVLKGGKPLAGFALKGKGRGDAVVKLPATDADGRTTVTLPSPGPWLLSGTDLRRSGGDWVSDFVTATFDVRRK